MGGLPGMNRYVNYKEDSLYGGSLYRGISVYQWNKKLLIFIYNYV
jgi:hypothetical protein